MEIQSLTHTDGIKFSEYLRAEYIENLTPTDWENMVLTAWERVGMSFLRKRRRLLFRFNDMRFYEIMPLRFRLSPDFQFSKSQKNIKKRNADLTLRFQPANITPEKLLMFDRWYADRFHDQRDIGIWLNSPKAFLLMELSVYKEEKLVACSFFDVTPTLQYSVMAMYDPEESKRSLGIFTLICEVEHAIAHKKTFHSPGYAWHTTQYDYKKRFHNTETFDWDAEKWVQQDRLKL
jgi:leucyl-tRNA---protein transferase